MPPRKTCRHAFHAVTYDNDDVLRDEAIVSMAAKIDMLAAQITKLFAEYTRTPERKDMSSESFPNPFSRHRHRTESTDDRRWESRLRIDIPELQGSGRP